MANSLTHEQVLALVCSMEEAAGILGVSTERAAQFAREGRLAAKRNGRDWMVVRASAEELARIPRLPGPQSEPRKGLAKKTKNPRKKRQ